MGSFQAKILLLGLLSLGAAGAASAGELVYKPLNPSFGGDPFYSAHLLQTAESQNDYRDDGDDYDSLFKEPSAADEFAEAMNSALIAGSASELAEAVFRSGAPAGEFSLDGAMATYETIGDRIKIRVTDGIQTNVIDVPVPDKR